MKVTNIETCNSFECYRLMLDDIYLECIHIGLCKVCRASLTGIYNYQQRKAAVTLMNKMICFHILKETIFSRSVYLKLK